MGAVLSICTVTTLLGALWLPARSLTVCAVEATAAPSLLNTWSAGQFVTPESASAQVKCTVTLLLYQPLPFGAVVATALMVGTVLSTFTVYSALPAFPTLSLQVARRMRVPSPEEVEEVVQF